MELHPFRNLEGVGLAAVGRLRNLADAQVADEVVGILGILRIGPDQQAVERRDRVNQREGGFPMAVEARRLVGHDVFQDAAFLGSRSEERRVGKEWVITVRSWWLR